MTEPTELSDSDVNLYQRHKYRVKEGPAALKLMERFIQRIDVGRLALNGKDYPYVIPTAHIYDRGLFYIHCAFEGKKLELIKSNPRVCYLVDGPIKPYPRDKRYYHHPWVSVIAYGEITEIGDPEERLRILHMYSKHYNAPYVQLDRARTTNMLMLTVSKMTGRYGKFLPQEKRVLLSCSF